MNNRLTIILEQNRLAPGETVQGTVSWDCPSDPGELMIKVGWHTEGQGDDDVYVLHEEQWSPAKSSGHRPFSFTLGQSPYSYSGALLRIVWCVTAESLDGLLFSRTDFIVGPNRTAVVLDQTP